VYRDILPAGFPPTKAGSGTAQKKEQMPAPTESSVAKAVASAEYAAKRQASQRRVLELRGLAVEGEEEDLEGWALLGARVQSLRTAAKKDARCWKAYFEAAQALLLALGRPEPSCAENLPECLCCERGSSWKFDPQKEKTVSSSPKEALRSVALGLRREAAMGWSRVDGGVGALGEVLADSCGDDDDADSELWTARGELFRKAIDDSSPLGSKILVEMHFEKAAQVDPRNDEAKEAYEAVKKKNDAEALLSHNNRPTLRGNKDLERAFKLCREGDAYMRENFFLSAATKFEAALAEIQEDDGLREARIACHLNIAACYALRGLGPKDDAIVEEQTTACLDLDDTNVPALLRRSEARQRRGNFRPARTDLCRVIAILDKNKGPQQSDRHRKATARLEHLDFLMRKTTVVV